MSHSHSRNVGPARRRPAPARVVIASEPLTSQPTETGDTTGGIVVPTLETTLALPGAEQQR